VILELNTFLIYWSVLIDPIVEKHCDDIVNAVATRI